MGPGMKKHRMSSLSLPGHRQLTKLSCLMMFDMEPNLVTDPKHLAVLHDLMQREPIFHRPEWGTTRRDFENMTEARFWEVGASGRRYSREYVLDELEKRYE